MRSRTQRVWSVLVGLALATTSACAWDGDLAKLPTTEQEDEAIYGATAAENLQTLRVDAEVEGLPKGWDGARVAVISDLNLGLWEGNTATAEAAVRLALAYRPEVVALLGDYVVGPEHFDALRRVLAPLRGRTVIGVLGDRDQRDAEQLQGRPDSVAMALRQVLRESGVVLLENKRLRLARRGDTVYFAGVEPYVARKPAWRQAEIFASIPRVGSTAMLLSHMPAAAYAAPDSLYPLIVAGHTFCGRVEVPGTPRLSWVMSELFPAAQTRVRGSNRLYRVNGNGLFVTCGVGYGFVPVRLGAAPEVALVTLRQPLISATPADTVPKPNLDSLIQQYQTEPAEADTASADST